MSQETEGQPQAGKSENQPGLRQIRTRDLIPALSHTGHVILGKPPCAVSLRFFSCEVGLISPVL